jgi:UDP-galactopyranose mutase
MVMSRVQNAGQSHSIKTDNSPFERVKDFKHLGATLTYQNSIQEEIKIRFNSGNACYYSVKESFVFQFAIRQYQDQNI